MARKTCSNAEIVSLARMMETKAHKAYLLRAERKYIEASHIDDDLTAMCDDMRRMIKCGVTPEQAHGGWE